MCDSVDDCVGGKNGLRREGGREGGDDMRVEGTYKLVLRNRSTKVRQ